MEPLPSSEGPAVIDRLDSSRAYESQIVEANRPGIGPLGLLYLNRLFLPRRFFAVYLRQAHMIAGLAHGHAQWGVLQDSFSFLKRTEGRIANMVITPHWTQAKRGVAQPVAGSSDFYERCHPLSRKTNPGRVQAKVGQPVPDDADQWPVDVTP